MFKFSEGPFGVLAFPVTVLGSDFLLGGFDQNGIIFHLVFECLDPYFHHLWLNSTKSIAPVSYLWLVPAHVLKELALTRTCTRGLLQHLINMPLLAAQLQGHELSPDNAVLSEAR